MQSQAASPESIRHRVNGSGAWAKTLRMLLRVTWGAGVLGRLEEMPNCWRWRRRSVVPPVRQGTERRPAGHPAENLGNDRLRNPRRCGTRPRRRPRRRPGRRLSLCGTRGTRGKIQEIEVVPVFSSAFAAELAWGEIGAVSAVGGVVGASRSSTASFLGGTATARGLLGLPKGSMSVNGGACGIVVESSMLDRRI